MTRKLFVTVSGSFHRHISKIQDIVNEFKDFGIEVISPADPRIVDKIGPFLFVASDKHRSVRLVQDRHLISISKSDFLWLVSPDGYVGQSAALELGYAIAFGIPVFSDVLPPDLTLRQYVNKVKNIKEAINRVRNTSNETEKQDVTSFLIDPTLALHDAHESLDELGKIMDWSVGKILAYDMSGEVYKQVDRINCLLKQPKA